MDRILIGGFGAVAVDHCKQIIAAQSSKFLFGCRCSNIECNRVIADKDQKIALDRFFENGWTYIRVLNQHNVANYTPSPLCPDCSVHKVSEWSTAKDGVSHIRRFNGEVTVKLGIYTNAVTLEDAQNVIRRLFHQTIGEFNDDTSHDVYMASGNMDIIVKEATSL